MAFRPTGPGFTTPGNLLFRLVLAFFFLLRTSRREQVVDREFVEERVGIKAGESFLQMQVLAGSAIRTRLSTFPAEIASRPVMREDSN